MDILVGNLYKLKQKLILLAIMTYDMSPHYSQFGTRPMSTLMVSSTPPGVFSLAGLVDIIHEN